MTKLFIDDERYPVTNDWFIARSTDEAVNFVEVNGLPTEISFDHDLGGSDTSIKFINWLVDYMLNKHLQFPKGFSFNVHSQNPVGKRNIEFWMSNLIKEFGVKQ